MNRLTKIALAIALVGAAQSTYGQLPPLPVPDNTPASGTPFPQTPQQNSGTIFQSQQNGSLPTQNLQGSVKDPTVRSDTQLRSDATLNGNNNRSLLGDAVIQNNSNLRLNAGSNTPPIPEEARLKGNISGNVDGTSRQAGQDQNQISGVDNSRNAPWRTRQLNGDWWYYTPENTWMYHRNNQWQAYSQDTFKSGSIALDNRGSKSQTFSSGYRGLMQPNVPGATNEGVSSGPVYVLQHDQAGREFICVSGQRVYFDNAQSRDQTSNNADKFANPDRAGTLDDATKLDKNGNLDSTGTPDSTPSRSPNINTAPPAPRL